IWPRDWSSDVCSSDLNLWQIREAGVGLLLGMKTARKPVAFVEDTAVDPARVAEYVRRFREIVERHGTRASFYGHASVGLLHTRRSEERRGGNEVLPRL